MDKDKTAAQPDKSKLDALWVKILVVIGIVVFALVLVFIIILIVVLDKKSSNDSPSAGSSSSIDPIKQLGIDALTYSNNYRATKSLAALKWNDAIYEQAVIHSQQMANNSKGFNHDGFYDRIAATGIAYTSAAENIAYNYETTNSSGMAVTQWINSDGHRENLEGDYTLCAIGAATNSSGATYFTQIFLKAYVY